MRSADASAPSARSRDVSTWTPTNLFVSQGKVANPDARTRVQKLPNKGGVAKIDFNKARRSMFCGFDMSLPPATLL
jgi:hypothetical protein